RPSMPRRQRCASSWIATLSSHGNPGTRKGSNGGSSIKTQSRELNLPNRPPLPREKNSLSQVERAPVEYRTGKRLPSRDSSCWRFIHIPSQGFGANAMILRSLTDLNLPRYKTPDRSGSGRAREAACEHG